MHFKFESIAGKLINLRTRWCEYRNYVSNIKLFLKRSKFGFLRREFKIVQNAWMFRPYLGDFWMNVKFESITGKLIHLRTRCCEYKTCVSKRKSFLKRSKPREFKICKRYHEGSFANISAISGCMSNSKVSQESSFICEHADMNLDHVRQRESYLRSV